MSEDQDESSKTEEPSQKKLEDAHEKGQWPLSREISIWVNIAGGTIIIGWFLPGILERLIKRLKYYIENANDLSMDSGGVGLILMRVVRDALLAIWLPVLLLMIFGVMGTIIQKGFSISWEAVSPDFSKLNPLNGLKKLFSLGSQGMELAKSVGKLVLIGVVATLSIMPMFPLIEQYVGIPISGLINEIYHLSYRLFTGVLAILTLIAGGDLIWQRFSYHKKMKMTKQEVKDEFKQTEGDPIVKNRMRQLRIEKARRRMMANVPKADVIITNPTHYAVALKYDTNSNQAPILTAKGVDQVALNIRRVAEDNDVPIVRNPPLARSLYATVELDEEIPAEHYRAVAEIISFVYKIKRKPLG
ncbi:Flagellar biosynthetic protein FlhB [Azospirillaceae bacterium]